MPQAATQADPQKMQCLEVWGGNEAVDHGVVMPGLDAWLYSRPYQGQAAGGDLHYVSSCAAGLVTRVLVADVSGHGETVAGMAVKLRGLMRRYVNYVDQTRLVVGLNNEFGELSEAGGFATAVAATYLAPEDKLTVSIAGHPPPLIYRAKKSAWSLVGVETPGNGSSTKPINAPLGIMETDYDQESIKFQTGDMAVFYTDSLIEAKDSANQMLGSAGLLKLVEGIDPSQPQDFLGDLLSGIKENSGDPHTADDVTILILRANNLKPAASLATNMKTMGRMAGAGLRHLLPGAEAYPWPQFGPIAKLGAMLHRVNRKWGMPAL